MLVGLKRLLCGSCIKLRWHETFSLMAKCTICGWQRADGEHESDIYADPLKTAIERFTK